MKIFPGLSYSLACQARTKIWVWSVLLLSIKHPQRINFFSNLFFCLFTLRCYIEREREKSQEMYCFFTLLCSFSFLFYYLFLHKTSAIISIFRIFKNLFEFRMYISEQHCKYLRSVYDQIAVIHRVSIPKYCHW